MSLQPASGFWMGLAETIPEEKLFLFSQKGIGVMRLAQGAIRLQAGDEKAFADLSNRLELDAVFVPATRKLQDFRLLAIDMDSTLVAVETLDELANFAGVKKEVAEITQKSMAGELDFKKSLLERLSLLQGLSQEHLERVYQERFVLNPGAADLVLGLKKKNIPTLLVSGGFTFFAKRVAQSLGIDFVAANVLEMKEGRLTGGVVGEILDGEGKKEALLQVASRLGAGVEKTIAAGDGANDKPMIEAAGLGIAWRSKPVLKPFADVVLEHAGLDGILYLFADSA